MLIYDFEVFKHDWLVCYLDTETRSIHRIINSKEELEKMYTKYKDTIWIGYNSRSYDVYIAKGILCGFDPYKITDWIINQDRKGYEYSRMLNQFPIINYDCSVGFRSLKELEAFMGNDIRETTVPFDIDRKLTDEELEEVIKYCEHDVWNTFEVFVETKSEFESHLGLVKEFNLRSADFNKTKAQLSAQILGAVKTSFDDEFDIVLPPTVILDKYEHVRQHYLHWGENVRNYDEIEYKTSVQGVPHIFGVGGIHGAIKNYCGDGFFVMSDVGSFYPAIKIEYGYVSRAVKSRQNYKIIRDDRIRLKAIGDPREYPRKIILNATFGATKDKYNPLYDPLQANNVCIGGQLLLLDLIEKLERIGKLIQSNTDGVLFKLDSKDDFDEYKAICDEWCERTRMTLEHEFVNRVVQKDVNNYIIVLENGKMKSKGAFVKKLSRLDNHLPIVNKAVKDYLISNVPVEHTIMRSNDLIDFQFITKVSGKYDHAIHGDQILHNKVYRVFASKRATDGTLYKKHKSKTTHDKTSGTPDNCFIWNESVNGVSCPDYLDKQWYVDLANERIKKFLGE